jgi:preprotein translocase subunit SecE
MVDNLKDSSEQVGGWFGRGRRFLSEVRSELGRVTWPTRREVWATTSS